MGIAANPAGDERGHRMPGTCQLSSKAQFRIRLGLFERVREIIQIWGRTLKARPCSKTERLKEALKEAVHKRVTKKTKAHRDKRGSRVRG